MTSRLTIGGRIRLGFALIVLIVAGVTMTGGMALTSAEHRAVEASQAYGFLKRVQRMTGTVADYLLKPSGPAAAKFDAAAAEVRAVAPNGTPLVSGVDAVRSTFADLAAIDSALAKTTMELGEAASQLRDAAQNLAVEQNAAYDANALKSAQLTSAALKSDLVSTELSALMAEALRLQIDVTRLAAAPDPITQREAETRVKIMPEQITSMKRTAPELVTTHSDAVADLEAASADLVTAFNDWSSSANAAPLNRAINMQMRAIRNLRRDVRRGLQQIRAQTRNAQEATAVSRAVAGAAAAAATDVNALAASAYAFMYRPQRPQAEAMAARYEVTQGTVDALAALDADAGFSTPIVSAMTAYARALETLTPQKAQRDAAFAALDAELKNLTADAATAGSSITDRAVSEAATARVGQLALGAAALLVGVAFAWVISRSVGGAVRRLADETKAIAEGDLAVVVSGARRRDEIGSLAIAVETFKANSLKIREMADEKARDDAAAEASRQEMMADLQNAFGVAVDGALKGDFSRRVSARYEEPVLHSLACGVNKLLETVEAGVAETQRVMGRVSDGDLGVTMNGEFVGAFARLRDDVNLTVSRLASLIEDVKETGAAIQVASREITSGAEDLSGRAASQASSLQETAATMEEMAATVKSNATNATKAAKLAAAAAARAGAGKDVVDEAVVAMGALEQSSGRISEIISVIDGIAFQTNLLALNAAVEAARAGDAGKGFAVVASEVRTLAQRSADAARDIAALISESTAEVGKGVTLVKRTGDALDGIVAGVADVTETIEEISRASTEQASGIDEISNAVSHMDGMTQQNAALSQQSAGSARSLNGTAERLSAQVATFSTNTSECETALSDGSAPTDHVAGANAA